MIIELLQTVPVFLVDLCSIKNEETYFISIQANCRWEDLGFIQSQEPQRFFPLDKRATFWKKALKNFDLLSL
jgi:hypothetical protein